MNEPTFRSVVEMFQHRVSSTPDAEAMSGRRDGQWHSMTWSEAGRRVRNVAGGLLNLGFKKEERGAILATSRPEWVIADLGILAAGGATSTIYTSNTAEESAYILEDSGSRVCFVENAMQEAKLREVRDRLSGIAHLILIDGEPMTADGWTITLAELENQGKAWNAANPGHAHPRQLAFRGGVHRRPEHPRPHRQAAPLPAARPLLRQSAGDDLHPPGGRHGH
jgi:long-chain acyl-CoA synthetase